MTNTFNRNDGTFAQVDLASLATTNFPLNSLTKATTANISLSSTASYVDGPSVSQGTSGTWFASGKVTLTSSVSSNFNVKLWDGTSIIASEIVTSGGGSGFYASSSLSGVLASPAGNIRISCQNRTVGPGTIIFNDSLNSADSIVTALRIG